MSLFNYIVWIVSLGYYNNAPSNTTQSNIVINNNKKFTLSNDIKNFTFKKNDFLIVKPIKNTSLPKKSTAPYDEIIKELANKKKLKPINIIYTEPIPKPLTILDEIHNFKFKNK